MINQHQLLMIWIPCMNFYKSGDATEADAEEELYQASFKNFG